MESGEDEARWLDPPRCGDHPFIIVVKVPEFGGTSDGSGTPPVTPPVTGQVTGQVNRLLSILKKELSRQEIQTRLGLKHRESFVNAYLKPALEAGLVEMTIPDKPRSSKQKYRLTEKGRRVLAAIQEENR